MGSCCSTTSAPYASPHISTDSGPAPDSPPQPLAVWGRPPRDNHAAAHTPTAAANNAAVNNAATAATTPHQSPLPALRIAPSTAASGHGHCRSTSASSSVRAPDKLVAALMRSPSLSPSSLHGPRLSPPISPAAAAAAAAAAHASGPATAAAASALPASPSQQQQLPLHRTPILRGMSPLVPLNSKRHSSLLSHDGPFVPDVSSILDEPLPPPISLAMQQPQPQTLTPGFAPIGRKSLRQRHSGGMPSQLQPRAPVSPTTTGTNSGGLGYSATIGAPPSSSSVVTAGESDLRRISSPSALSTPHSNYASTPSFKPMGGGGGQQQSQQQQQQPQLTRKPSLRGSGTSRAHRHSLPATHMLGMAGQFSPTLRPAPANAPVGTWPAARMARANSVEQRSVTQGYAAAHASGPVDAQVPPCNDSTSATPLGPHSFSPLSPSNLAVLMRTPVGAAPMSGPLHPASSPKSMGRMQHYLLQESTPPLALPPPAVIGSPSMRGNAGPSGGSLATLGTGRRASRYATPHNLAATIERALAAASGGARAAAAPSPLNFSLGPPATRSSLSQNLPSSVFSFNAVNAQPSAGQPQQTASQRPEQQPQLLPPLVGVTLAASAPASALASAEPPLASVAPSSPELLCAASS